MTCENSGLAPVVVVAEGVVEQDAAEYVLGFALYVGIVDLLVEFAVVGVVAHYVVGIVVWVVDGVNNRGLNNSGVNSSEVNNSGVNSCGVNNSLINNSGINNSG